MKKQNWLITSVLFLFIFFSSCNNAGNRNNAAESDRDTTQTENYGLTEVIYTCPMHPEVTSDAPGQCPKCGMDLVKKEGDGHSVDTIGDTVTL